MSGLPLAKPEEIGFIPARLQHAYDLLAEWTRTDKVPAASVCVGRKGRMLEPRFFGGQRPEAREPALRKDALFLVASITKPVTVTAVMMLVERGLLALEDRVAAYVPRFAQNGKKDVLIRHLMTHTSGLPDMLPDNNKMRAAHKPLAAFIDETCKIKPAFPPGTQVSYQSMGTAMLSEVVHQITGASLAEFLSKEVFGPLQMTDTSLGWNAAKKERIAAVRLPAEQIDTDWGWNTPYWLGFGAPWGGMITTPADFARFCQMMLNGGVLNERRILSPATVRAMTANQLAAMPHVPEEDRRCRPWGLGWKHQWPGHAESFGDLVGSRTIGHWGATGTLCWIDPDAEAFCIVFTTQPLSDEGRFLARISNVVMGSLA
jgi:CubicO group peptidase (beta-lactamase class C family)